MNNKNLHSLAEKTLNELGFLNVKFGEHSPGKFGLTADLKGMSIVVAPNPEYNIYTLTVTSPEGQVKHANMPDFTMSDMLYSFDAIYQQNS